MLDFGISAAQFEARHAERQPYLRRGALAGVPRPWSEIDELLHHLEPTDEDLQLHRQGLIPQASYTAERVSAGRRRRRLVKPRLHEELRRGATLVLNRVESGWLRAQTLCDAVSGFTRRTTTANAYLAFAGGADGFGAHWDTHDVFALQLIGRKRWLVFEPTFPLPLSAHRSQGSGHRRPPTPVLDVELEAGDLLYLPRGWWHQVLPLDVPSLHLSVGTYGATIYDYLMWIASRHLPEQLTARSSFKDETLPADLASALQTLAQAATDPESLTAFRRRLLEHETRAAGETVDLAQLVPRNWVTTSR